MLGGSRSKQILPIALDVSSTAITILQLEKTRLGYRVLAACKNEFPNHLRRSQERQTAIAESLGKLIKEHRFVGRHVVSSLSNSAIQYKSFRLPSMPPDEMMQVAQFEAEERFGFKNTPAEYRHVHVGQVRQGQEVREEIIAMGCRGEILDTQLQWIEQLKLINLTIEPTPISIVRCFEHGIDVGSNPEQARVYVDVGYNDTRIVISKNDTILFIKSIAVGGKKFDELVAKGMNLSAIEAGSLRRDILSHYQFPHRQRPSVISDEVIESTKTSLRPGIETLGKELSLCLRYYAVTFRGVRPEEIICTGGECYDPGLMEYLSEVTGVPCVVGQPFANIDTAEVFNEEEKNSGLLEWASVVGLALWQKSSTPSEKVAV